MRTQSKLNITARIFTFLAFFSGAAFAAPLKENSAYIEQAINIPGMVININPGGSGCNSANNEKWEPTEGGCSNIEYLKKTAQVISLAPSPAAIYANNSAASTLSAVVVDEQGKALGAGVPVTFGNNLGNLSASTAITNASSIASVTLSGSVAGTSTVTARAAAGSTRSATVALVSDPSSATVIQLSATPTSIPATGSAYSTLSALVRDAYGNALGAGVPVAFWTNFGNLSAGSSNTDASGVASVYLSGTVAGTATVSARAATPTTQSATVTLTNAAPQITAFSQQGRAKGNGIKYWTANTLTVDGDSGYYFENEFNWSATGADRYEILDNWGDVVYSGTSNQLTLSNMPIPGQFGSKLYINGHNGVMLNYTIRAYSGSNYSSSTITVRLWWYNCSGGCST